MAAKPIAGVDMASFHRRQAAIVVLFTANGVACTWIACFLSLNFNVAFFAVFFALGVAFAQAMLLALWSALGESLGVLRILGSLFLLSLSVAPFAILGQRESQDWSAGMGIGILMLIHWFVGQTPLWLLRIILGVCIIRMHDEREAGGERQFSVGQLLWVTAIVSLLFAAGRAAYLAGGLENVFGNRSDAILSILMICVDLILSLLAMRAVLTERRIVVWLTVSLFFAGALTWLAGLLLRALTTYRTFDEVLFFYLIAGGQYLWLVLCLFLVRIAGYRWTRRNKYPAPPAMYAVEKPPTHP